MKLINKTPFVCDLFEQYDKEGRIYTVIAIRGTFILKLIDGNTSVIIAEKQDPFMWEDEYGTTEKGLTLLKQCDFIPYKPATDVTLNASCWSYKAQISKQTVELHVNDFVKRLNIYGSRRWYKDNSDKWKITTPELIKSIPIRWQSTFGGSYITNSNIQDGDIYNPIGCGFIDFDNTPPNVEGFNAPQIEYPDEPLTQKISQKRAGFLPIAPSWESRLKFAGTYDETWKETRHPLLPRDFDSRFWNCAPLDQQHSPWLKGGESIKLINLHSYAYMISFNLPKQTILCGVHSTVGEPYFLEMVLDGVHIDMERDIHPYINMCWRVNFPYDLDIKKITLINGISKDDALSKLEESDVI